MNLGLKGNKEVLVTESLLAKNVGSGTVAVFATPMMIAAMEGAAAESVEASLEEGKTTVGISMNATHIAATPEGMKVRIETELEEVNGKVLTFKIIAFDEVEKIGEALHKRAIVSKNSFEERAKKKCNM